MTDHLSPLDAAFLEVEDEEPEVSMAIASIAIMEGPPPSREELVEATRRRLPLVPLYRQKARQVPFDLGAPVLVDDPDFDLDRHIRHVCVAEPGDDAALCERIGEIMSRRLDRERPLWEYWLLDGLSGGRWALVSKVHHCLVGGVSGANLYYVLFDLSPDGDGRQAPLDAYVPDPGPSTSRLIVDAVRDLLLNPIEQLRMIGEALRTPRATAQRIADTGRGLLTLAGSLGPASRSTLNGPIGERRRYAVARASLTEMKQAARQASASLNDVALSAITGAFRSLLLQRGEEPDPHAMRTAVPVSVRAAGDEGVCTNRISVMLAFLPVHLADPGERLQAVHAHLTELKASMEAQACEAMTTLARHEPFPPVSWATRLLARLPQRSVVTVTTNVPGPPVSLYLLGRRALEIFPYVPIIARLRTGVSIFSYCDQVAFGVTGDYDSAPEVERFACAIEEELGKLVRSAAA
ncbi:wax ester/triacylglycerol synthase family O-acyltransferase [Nonomuraea sp. NPDC049400]|uniref:wax ester/triacylglycerol synthase family O-acyltransferase n=1 Tax=Nonomuraea sp. NPDC049400 TaxID=3364352 RepID=UPI00378A2002